MGSPRRFRIAREPHTRRLIAYCVDCSFPEGEIVEVIEAVLTDELVETVACDWNDRDLANPTHGAFWPQLEDSEKDHWRRIVREVLHRAGFQEEGRDDG